MRAEGVEGGADIMRAEGVEGGANIMSAEGAEGGANIMRAGGAEGGANIARGFSAEEVGGRIARAQEWMAEEKTDATLLTTEAEVRYFSNFHTPFWQSPSRPWFLILPAMGAPVAVVPEIGVARMRAAGVVRDIRSWPSPRPDDEGASEVASALREVAGAAGKRRVARVAIPSGAESFLRMPLSDFHRLTSALDGAEFADATPMLRALMGTKSECEIEKIRRACRAASGAFSAAPELFAEGMSCAEVFRALKAECIRRGADDAPYLTGGASAEGCADVIAPPSERALRRGDVLNLDLGCVWDGYYSDFNRNFSVGKAGAETARAYAALRRATEKGIAAARPGVLCSDVFRAMANSLEGDGANAGAAGRMGHGVGMRLTEWPSVAGWDATVLKAGMVLAIEPTAVFDSGFAMTHEENVVVRDGGAELLSAPAAMEIAEV